MANVEELQTALDFPWEKWTVFLHPEQRQWVDRTNTGPARVSGSAGTGKTIVALHRAVHLARAHPGARVLLTTFSDTLAHALHTKLKRLIDPATRGRTGVSRDLLSVKAIQAAKPAAREYLLGDGDGLFLRVLPTGRKTWQFIYSHGERRRKLSLGDLSDVSLSAARARA